VVPALQRHRPRFAERNTFLFALLGAVSLGRELEALLPDTPHRDPPPARPLDRESLHGLYLLLGLVSVSRTVSSILRQWAPAGDASRANDEVQQSGTTEEFLR
jgi:hypothetical protein